MVGVVLFSCRRSILRDAAVRERRYCAPEDSNAIRLRRLSLLVTGSALFPSLGDTRRDGTHAADGSDGLHTLLTEAEPAVDL